MMLYRNCLFYIWFEGILPSIKRRWKNTFQANMCILTFSTLRNYFTKVHINLSFNFFRLKYPRITEILVNMFISIHSYLKKDTIFVSELYGIYDCLPCKFHTFLLFVPYLITKNCYYSIEKNVDNESVYKMANVMSECDGLEALLTRFVNYKLRGTISSYLCLPFLILCKQRKGASL